MNLDEAAKRLGYVDADHVERNIEAYGEPLLQWWEVIKELVNKLPLNDVINCDKCGGEVLYDEEYKSTFCNRCYQG
jgi:formylmethanofuran dehydrogenase subunit E